MTAYSKDEIKRLLAIARGAALKSGDSLIHAGQRLRRVEVDLKRDVKIFADRASERIIVKYLSERSAFPILTEESGLLKRGRSAGGLRWIVDPLDGTINYSRALPVSCVSIGLWDENKPLAGVIYDFNRSELFTGITGSGSWLNGGKIRVGGLSAKEKAVLLTGFPGKADHSQKALSRLVAGIRRYKKVRLIGSAALSLAYVASARADVYFEKDIMLWDVAAGIPIVLGAGGAVKIDHPRGDDICDVKASNAYLMAEGKRERDNNTELRRVWP
ncbi:MAG: inositol monophosphatase family protein [Candidatus Omnitrophota bacterium]